MPIIIRDSLPSDIPAITEIYRHAVRYGTASFEIDPPHTAELALRRETLLASGYPYLVAEQDGSLVGYSYAGPTERAPATASPWKIRFTCHLPARDKAWVAACSRA